jgi:hypothetical protein
MNPVYSEGGEVLEHISVSRIEARIALGASLTGAFIAVRVGCCVADFDNLFSSVKKRGC